MGSLESEYYNFMHYDREHSRDVLSFYVPFFADAAPVLELGSGRGEFLALLREKGIDASGVDNDEGMVRESREAGVEVVHDDAIAYVERAPAASVGGVFCAHFLEHLAVEDVRRVLRGARRVLRDGGTFVAAVPNPQCYAVLSADFWRDPTHVRFYDLAAVAFLCEEAGFRIEQMGPNPQNHAGPPPGTLTDESQLVHPGLADAIRDELLSGPPPKRWQRDRRADAAYRVAVAHLLEVVSGRLAETEQALQDLRRSYRELVLGLYQANEVFVLARS